MSAGTQLSHSYPVRRLFVLGLFLIGMGLLALRAVELQVFEHDFLQRKGDARQTRVIEIPAHRGVIMDRHGEPLAVSTPVDSIWVNPRKLEITAETDVAGLNDLLGMKAGRLQQIDEKYPEKSFVYLQRHLSPDLAAQVMDLDIDGVGLQREYRRYYPMGEIFGHVLGFTNIDDKGQEGIELAYEDWLKGIAGSKRVKREGRGRVIDVIELVKQEKPGRDLRLSLDARIQYLAYRELKAAVKANKAESGSVVVLRPSTGEVLAMVNQPYFNPNNRGDRKGEKYRNRAVKDVFEPGSTAKPFTIAAALESGLFTRDSIINTNPGTFRVSGFPIKDTRNHGKIDLGTIISQSSNVGASKLAMELPRETLWQTFNDVGFGASTGSSFPGEVKGVLRDFSQWYPLDQATLSYGYGFSVTPLQLARAYGAIADDGAVRNVSFMADPEDTGVRQVMKPETARIVREMMLQVVQPQGTGYRAAVEGFDVAGKTGTAKKAVGGGYSKDTYTAIFAGMAPAAAPQLVIVVMIDEPQAGKYYGGQVAAPVFSRIMSGALRQLNVPPDGLQKDMNFRLQGEKGEPV